MNGRYGLKVFVLVERNASRPERETPGLRNFRSEPLKAPLVQAQWRAQAGRQSTQAVSCAEPPPQPPAPKSVLFADGAACGCGHAPCPGVSIFKRSARGCRSALPAPMQARSWSGSPPEPSALSSPLFLNQWRTILCSSDQWRIMARL